MAQQSLQHQSQEQGHLANYLQVILQEASLSLSFKQHGISGELLILGDPISGVGVSGGHVFSLAKQGSYISRFLCEPIRRLEQLKSCGEAERFEMHGPSMYLLNPVPQLSSLYLCLKKKITLTCFFIYLPVELHTCRSLHVEVQGQSARVLNQVGGDD